MTKFIINKVLSGPPEEVSADLFLDNPPFVDFVLWTEGSSRNQFVARYRQDDIRRITRADDNS